MSIGKPVYVNSEAIPVKSYYLIPDRSGQKVPTPPDDNLSRQKRREQEIAKWTTECLEVADRVIEKYPAITREPGSDLTISIGLPVTAPLDLDMVQIGKEFNCTFVPIEDVVICLCP